MMIVTHEMDFARKISNRIFFMDEGGIYEEGTPKEIFDHPQKEKTRRFIQRLTTLRYKIESTSFDVEAMNEELQSYGEKLLIESERLSKLSIALEEICINNIAAYEDNPDIIAQIEYSEKSDTLCLFIKYKGEPAEATKSDNELFLSVLADKTTTIKEYTMPDPDGYVNRLDLSFGWIEE